MVEAAFVREHVEQHVAHVDLGPCVFVEVAEGVRLKGVDILVEPLNVGLTKALGVHEQLIVLVESALETRQEPVDLSKPEPRLGRVDEVRNTLVVVVDLIGVLLIFERLMLLLWLCLYQAHAHHRQHDCAKLIAYHFLLILSDFLIFLLNYYNVISSTKYQLFR